MRRLAGTRPYISCAPLEECARDVQRGCGGMAQPTSPLPRPMRGPRCSKVLAMEKGDCPVLWFVFFFTFFFSYFFLSFLFVSSYSFSASSSSSPLFLLIIIIIMLLFLLLIIIIIIRFFFLALLLWFPLMSYLFCTICFFFRYTHCHVSTYDLISGTMIMIIIIIIIIII